MSVYVLFAISVVIATVGQIMMKYSSQRTELTFSLDLIKQILTNVPLLFTFGLYFLGAVLWLFVVKKLPISVAYPALSINYVALVIVSYFVFHEAITPMKIFALSLIVVGVFVLFKYG